jgi:hypothetical protein
MVVRPIFIGGYRFMAKQTGRVLTIEPHEAALARRFADPNGEAVTVQTEFGELPASFGDEGELHLH